MKCISCMQPWAWLLCVPLKDIENRSRRSDYRGPCLIHASKTFDREGMQWFRERFGAALLDKIPRDVFKFGAIIGQVNIDNCVTSSVSPWFVGPYGYVRSRPVLFKKPIPYRGLPSLFFDVPDSFILEQLRLQGLEAPKIEADKKDYAGMAKTSHVSLPYPYPKYEMVKEDGRC